MFFTTPVVSYIICMYAWNQQPHLLQTVDDGSSFANLIHYLDTWERVSHRSQLNVITVGGKFNSLSRVHRDWLWSISGKMSTNTSSGLMLAAKKIKRKLICQKAEWKTSSSKWFLSLSLCATVCPHSDISVMGYIKWVDKF